MEPILFVVVMVAVDGIVTAQLAGDTPQQFVFFGNGGEAYLQYPPSKPKNTENNCVCTLVLPTPLAKRDLFEFLVRVAFTPLKRSTSLVVLARAPETNTTVLLVFFLFFFRKC